MGNPAFEAKPTDTKPQKEVLWDSKSFKRM